MKRLMMMDYKLMRSGKWAFMPLALINILISTILEADWLGYQASHRQAFIFSSNLLVSSSLLAFFFMFTVSKGLSLRTSSPKRDIFPFPSFWAQPHCWSNKYCP